MAEKGIKYWKKKAWDYFSKYTRLKAARDYDSFTHAKCCTCGKVYPIGGVGCLQAGHYVPGRLNSVLYEEHCCHAQCYMCNIRLKGNPIEYRNFMVARYGEEETERVEMLRFKVLQMKAHDHEAKYHEYKQKYEDLLKGVT